MDVHYNAFISYRHHPDDIRVAMEIHRGLERFKVPKAIKKRNSGPMRLFRDKEELPITSHLTDDISHALENSDFLIVICSPHTKESVWVQREIETFLKTHSRDKVLTVLASGEPYDVIPDVLLHEDVLDPITGQIRDNLDQALRNQSEYLASAAGERMEAGDRLTAIALALAALPDEDSTRPYVPEAERALSEAISSYQSTAEVSAMGSFTADGLARQFQVTQDGKLLYIMDARKVVTVWDTGTFQKLATFENSEHALDTMYLTPAGNVIITTDTQGGKLLCYRPDGTLLWSLDHCVDIAFVDQRREILLRIDEFNGMDQIAFADTAPSSRWKRPGRRWEITSLLRSRKPITV